MRSCGLSMQGDSAAVGERVLACRLHLPSPPGDGSSIEKSELKAQGAALPAWPVALPRGCWRWLWPHRRSVVRVRRLVRHRR